MSSFFRKGSYWLPYARLQLALVNRSLIELASLSTVGAFLPKSQKQIATRSFPVANAFVCNHCAVSDATLACAECIGRGGKGIVLPACDPRRQHMSSPCGCPCPRCPYERACILSHGSCATGVIVCLLDGSVEGGPFHPSGRMQIRARQ